MWAASGPPMRASTCPGAPGSGVAADVGLGRSHSLWAPNSSGLNTRVWTRNPLVLHLFFHVAEGPGLPGLGFPAKARQPRLPSPVPLALGGPAYQGQPSLRLKPVGVLAEQARQQCVLSISPTPRALHPNTCAPGRILGVHSSLHHHLPHYLQGPFSTVSLAGLPPSKSLPASLFGCVPALAGGSGCSGHCMSVVVVCSWLPWQWERPESGPQVEPADDALASWPVFTGWAGTPCPGCCLLAQQYQRGICVSQPLCGHAWDSWDILGSHAHLLQGLHWPLGAPHSVLSAWAFSRTSMCVREYGG